MCSKFTHVLLFILLEFVNTAYFRFQVSSFEIHCEANSLEKIHSKKLTAKQIHYSHFYNIFFISFTKSSNLIKSSCVPPFISMNFFWIFGCSFSKTSKSFFPDFNGTTESFVPWNWYNGTFTLRIFSLERKWYVILGETLSVTFPGSQRFTMSWSCLLYTSRCV